MARRLSLGGGLSGPLRFNRADLSRLKGAQRGLTNIGGRSFRLPSLDLFTPGERTGLRLGGIRSDRDRRQGRRPLPVTPSPDQFAAARPSQEAAFQTARQTGAFDLGRGGGDPTAQAAPQQAAPTGLPAGASAAPTVRFTGSSLEGLTGVGLLPGSQAANAQNQIRTAQDAIRGIFEEGRSGDPQQLENSIKRNQEIVLRSLNANQLQGLGLARAASGQIVDPNTGEVPAFGSGFQATGGGGGGFAQQGAAGGANTLSGVFDPELSLAQQEAQRLQDLSGSRRQDEQSRLDQAFRNIEEEQRAIFAPQFQAARESGERTRESARRGFAFRGFGRSSTAAGEEERLNKLQSDQEAAISAAQSASIRLQRAAARGASDEVLRGIGQQVQEAQDRVLGIERERALAEGAFDEARQLASQGAELKQAETLAAAREADKDLSKLTGFLVNSEGQALLDSEGGKISTNVLEFVGGTKQQASGFFDPITGTFTPFSQLIEGGTGTGGRGTGGGGTARGGGGGATTGGGLVERLRESINPNTNAPFNSQEIANALEQVFPGTSAKATAQVRAGLQALQELGDVPTGPTQFGEFTLPQEGPGFAEEFAGFLRTPQ